MPPAFRADPSWEYTIRHYKGARLLLVTVHLGEASRDVEILAAVARMKRGEVSHVEIFSPKGAPQIMDA